MKRFIHRKYHSMADYLAAVFLIAAPWLFHFNRVYQATWMAVVIGTLILIIALNTDYEFGYTKMISMKTHLKADMVGGIFLGLSPWLLGFSGKTFLLHLLMGVGLLGLSLLSQSGSEHPRAPHLDDEIA